MERVKSEKPLEKPESINPEITKNFVGFIKEKSESGIYRVEVKVGDKIVPIDVFPTVFPPQSDYSASSKSLFETFKNLDGAKVADVGSGSGVESIIAIMAGANHVDAGDINQQAVNCSRHNAEINGLKEKIEVFYSNLFQEFPKKKYNLIIANLPIVDFGAEKDNINASLYDKDLEIHRKFFAEAKNYLAEDGVILIPHANLQSAKTSNPNYDFQILEQLIGESGFEVVGKSERKDLGYEWINYKIKLKKII